MKTQLQLDLETQLRNLGAKRNLTYRLCIHKTDWWIVDVREGKHWNAIGGGTPDYISGLVAAMTNE